jgi:hypothetical protein
MAVIDTYEDAPHLCTAWATNDRSLWRMLGGTAVKTILTCPDRPWDSLCTMMGQVTLAVVVSTLVFKSVGRHSTLKITKVPEVGSDEKLVKRMRQAHIMLTPTSCIEIFVVPKKNVIQVSLSLCRMKKNVAPSVL